MYTPLSLTRMWNLRPWRRGALMRRSDRAQSLAHLTAAVMVVLALPIAIVTGMAVDHAVVHSAACDVAAARQVDAVIDGASVVNGTLAGGLVARAYWSLDGVTHHDDIAVTAATRPGDHMPVRVHSDGTPVPPTLPGQAVFDGIFVAAGVSLAIVVAAVSLRRGVDVLLARRRARQWDAAWAAFTEHGRRRLR
jgi:hypothetical protein